MATIITANWLTNDQPARGYFDIDLSERLVDRQNDRIYPRGRFASGPLKVNPSLHVTVPSTDDPLFSHTDFGVWVTIHFDDKRLDERYFLNALPSDATLDLSDYEPVRCQPDGTQVVVGADGRGITGISVETADGVTELVIEYDDGTTERVTLPMDEITVNVEPALSIDRVEQVTPGTMTVWMTDGTSVDIELPRGPQGVPGKDGVDGAPGVDGKDGAPGPQGPAGPEGPQGLPGKDGAAGPQGPAGPEGPQGPQGLPGKDGAPGADGTDGAVGPQGVPGNDGEAGPQGPQGPQGLPGKDGAIGPQGPAGADGIDGTVSFEDLTDEQRESLRGPQGVPGTPGADGEDGAAGPQGPEGPQGPPGKDGAIGPQGPAGPAGADGIDGTVSFEDLTDEQRESLRGPQGDTGPQGPKGEIGPAGPKGDTGDTGPRGPAGVDGTDGEPGADGQSALEVWLAQEENVGKTADDFFAALKGETGERGPAGADGKDGVDGAPGADGQDGARGPEGPQGPQGERGPEGPQGPQGPAGEGGGGGFDIDEAGSVTFDHLVPFFREWMLGYGDEYDVDFVDAVDYYISELEYIAQDSSPAFASFLMPFHLDLFVSEQVSGGPTRGVLGRPGQVVTPVNAFNFPYGYHVKVTLINLSDTDGEVAVGFPPYGGSHTVTVPAGGEFSEIYSISGDNTTLEQTSQGGQILYNTEVFPNG